MEPGVLTEVLMSVKSLLRPEPMQQNKSANGLDCAWLELSSGWPTEVLPPQYWADNFGYYFSGVSIE